MLVGLASRLLPHVIDVAEGLGSGPRLRYPLGYWNANGALCGIGVAMLLWLSRGARWTPLRWLAVAAMPAVMLTLYFTYSRGGVLALAIGALTIVALSRDRLWILATLAIAAVGALPALIAVPANRSLADNIASQSSVDQGVTVLLILLAGTGLSLALFALLRRLERRGGPRTRRAVAFSRDRRVLRGAAIAAVLVTAIAAIAFGGRAWEEFSNSDLVFPNDPAQHFSDLTSAGRHDFWRVAVDAFDEKPLVGHGAGTYEFSWDRLRSIPLTVVDAHSLYLEAFAELGLLGGLLVLALVLTILWIGISAWRAAGPARARLTRRSSPRCWSSLSAPASTGSGRSPGSARSSASPPARSSPPAANSSPTTPNPLPANAASASPSPASPSPGSPPSP